MIVATSTIPSSGAFTVFERIYRHGDQEVVMVVLTNLRRWAAWMSSSILSFNAWQLLVVWS